MTIKVGDSVQVNRGNGWSDMEYTVLAIQDCDPDMSRKWAVVVYMSDIPQVFKLHDVRKKEAIELVRVDGSLLPDGSIIIGHHNSQYGYLHPVVSLTFTKVDGKVDLTKPYTVTKKS